MTNQKKLLSRLTWWSPPIGLVLFFGLILWGYLRGIFRSVTSLQTFIEQFGNYMVPCFIFLQTVQVIIPILSGGVSSVVGMLMFGSLQGFLYSHPGLIVGEFIDFSLVHYYGRSFVKIILSPNKYKKFEEILGKNGHSIRELLISTMLVPLTLGDIVCLVVGVTDISLEELIKITLLLKSWSVATYSYLVLYLFQLLGKL